MPADDPVLIHADAQLLVLCKPAGLPSVPGKAPGLQHCLAGWAQARWPEARIVHRLDMATSGLIVMARGLEAQRALGRAFEQRRVDKRYEAVVAGRPEATAGSVDLPLICDWPNRPRQIVDATRGKAALTHWQVLGPGPLPRSTRLALTPVTGRSHQLRVHLASIGHAILGDTLYASADEQARAERLLLHACRLALPHPADGELRAFEAPAPF